MKLILHGYCFFIWILFNVLNLTINDISANNNVGQEITTLYGNFTINEPILLDLIASKAMQRLALINQYGIDYYTLKNENYNRLEHSIAVCILTRKYGAGLHEQIAALLHDVSHTAFSHVADFIYKSNDLGNAYQDDIHEQFIINCDLKDILNKHGIQVSQILSKNKEFTILESELPDICADRLEYNLRGGFIQGLLVQTDIDNILKALHFSHDRWFFRDLTYAKKFALVSLYLTEHRWGSASGIVRNIYASNALKRANLIKLITWQEFNSGTDDTLWNKLITSNDAVILDLISKMYKVDNTYILSDKDYDIFLSGKFRGIDPWICIENRYFRLTELDTEFKNEFNRIKNLIKIGLRIKFKQPAIS